MIHALNIILHVTAGIAALIVGAVTIILCRRSNDHKRWGRYFLYLLCIVVSTGYLGWLFFRSQAFLLMLTLVSGYVGYSGFRTVRLRERKASNLDALVALFALATGIAYVVSLREGKEWSPTVIYSTLGALALVTLYDLLKFLWLYPRIKSWWLYEHIYKMISAFSALLSAFAGTVLPQFKPYSQVGPGIACTILIVIFIIQQARQRQLSSHIPAS
ncbi:MAG TPA: hypothetical protein VIN08_17730 [Ohtaekwangia sp.]|uniref:hypothetical protein n=1 Tax=Ohtaekwangia sp. TaxID=2066019 RepID=UPI002F922B09